MQSPKSVHTCTIECNYHIAEVKSMFAFARLFAKVIQCNHARFQITHSPTTVIHYATIMIWFLYCFYFSFLLLTRLSSLLEHFPVYTGLLPYYREVPQLQMAESNSRPLAWESNVFATHLPLGVADRKLKLGQ